MGQEVAEHNGMSSDLHESTSILKEHAKHVYSKDFLLSVADLEDCKRPPAGLDPVLLRQTHSELVDGGVAIPAASSRGLIRESHTLVESPPDVPEWRRPSSLPGSSFLQQGFRQPEINNPSSRPGPAWGDNVPARSNMDRSGASRWEPRLGGGDREKEKNRLHRELDSTDLGGRFQGGGLARSGFVAQEHDGLLGSGGPIVQKGMLQTRTTDRHLVSGRTSRMGQTGEQYHPAHGGKVSQYSRREDTDSVNDETFGAEQWSNEDRSEQERQRRDSFEQMRKEQRMNPKEVIRKHDDNWIWDGEQNNETLLSSSPGTPHSLSSKDDTLKAHNRPVGTTSTSRLLVPPGFSKAALQKSGSLKENNEASKAYLSNVEDEGMHVVKQRDLDDSVRQDTRDDFNSVLLKNDQLTDKIEKTSSPLQPPVVSKFARWFPCQGDSIKETGLTCDNIKPMHLFSKSEDLAMPGNSFLETLDVGRGSKDVSCLMPAKSQGFVLPMPVGPSLEDVERVMTASSDTDIVVSSTKDWATDKETRALGDHSLSAGHAILSNTPLPTEALQMQNSSFKDLPQLKVSPVFLTCEDVEQSLLAETVQYSDNESPFGFEEVQQDIAKSKNLSQLLQRGSIRKKTDSNFQQSQAVEKDASNDMNGNASQHIMSLLQKRTGEGIKASHLEESGSPVAAETTVYLAAHDHRTEDLEKNGKAAEVISLETLFGKVFANELRSVGEPVSSKKVLDDPAYVGKENGFQSLLDAVPSSRQTSRKSGHADVGKRGWGFDFHHPDTLLERKQSENSLESDLHNDLWPDMSSHGHAHLENLNTSENSPTSRGRPTSRSGLGDFGQPKLSPRLPHQGHFFNRPHYEGQYLPASQMPSHGKPLEPMHEPHFIHESTPHGMGMYPTNGPFHPGNFLQSSNHVQGQFGGRLDGRSGGAYRMSSAFPSEYPESVQMGFDLSHRMPGHGVGGLGINPSSDGWFAGDPSQTSQVVVGFNPHHPTIIPERNPGYGGSGPGMGPGGNGHNMGSPLDKLINSETTQFPYAPGYDSYVLPDRRLRYG